MLLQSLVALGLPLPAFAAASRYDVRLISGGTDGNLWRAGIAIAMEKNWKTYWRVPGDSGIPPQFDWSGSEKVDGIEVLYPVPRRYNDESGESLSYKDEVVFPVNVTTASQPAKLSLGMFFGVCDVVCIPAQAKIDLVQPMASGAPADVALLERWSARVPKKVSNEGPVKSARLDKDSGRLVLALDGAFDDVFIESETSAFFRKPEFSGGEASIAISGLADLAKLDGRTLTITLAQGESGLEQQVRLA
jgi:DsbC/DsbD-like thiol-disulfide interchange protein